MGDDAGTGRWMTYDELAAVRGIKRIGAVRLVQRHKWRRQAGNDGHARILVPHDALRPVPRTAARIDASSAGAATSAGTDAGNAAGTGVEAVLAALREAHGTELARLTEAVTAERTRADSLREAIAVLEAKLAGSEGALAEARAHAEQAETSRDADRARAEALRQMLDEAEAAEERARARAEAAEDYVEALRQTEEARRGRGVLARLGAAWRGE